MNIHYKNIGPYVLAMASIILSPTFSLYATNILKLYLLIYAPARLHGMPLLLLNQFLTYSARARILPGKHSIAFRSMQLGGVLIWGTCEHTIVSSLTGISSCANLQLLSCRRYALWSPVLIDKEFCVLQFPHFYKKKKKLTITQFIRQVQRHIHNPVNLLRWNFLWK